MRRFLWAAPLLLVLISSGAWADTFVLFAPTYGEGDNFGIVQQSREMTVFLAGGTPVSFFSGFGYAPGSTLGGSGDVFLDSEFAEIDGNFYDLDDLFTASPFMTGIMLPTNDASSVTELVTLSFEGSGTISDTGQVVNVGGSVPGEITFVEGYPGLLLPRLIRSGF